MIIRGGTVVTARGVGVRDIAIQGDWISAVGKDLEAEGQEIDATGHHIFPGGIDSHVHFNEPGRTEWEDISHGSAALAAGGYTSFIDMPLNNVPVTTTADAFDLKLAAMERSSRIDFGLWGGLVPGSLDDLDGLVRRGVIGVKAFMCPSGLDEFPACDEATLRDGMDRIGDLGSVMLVHAELPELLRVPEGPSIEEFVESRPPGAEVEAIRLALDFAYETGCSLHIVHVSTTRGAEMIEYVRGHYDMDVSGETCPHYMLYTAGDLKQLGGMGKCAPPLRDERMKIMPIVVSDHSPCSLDLKRGHDFRKIWGGISGCQSTRQLLLAQDGLDLPTIAAVTSTNIAERFGLTNKGDIAPGFDADLWIVDLSHQDVVRRQDLLYRNPFSAHEGQPIRGRTVSTLVRGRTVFANGRPATKPVGQLIRAAARS